MYGPNLKETIKEKLVEVVENTCSERYGFILKVFNVDTERLEGRIESTGTQSGSGVKYETIVFLPFRPGAHGSD
eukprot:CAMPEP_0179431416 /NCGR_PEP_ID=MMETSP0799-20121207/16314_1 /TAXON_ID=46947 /ORGANISM="Geminigera cryophila, Strain CCMP2564" /LENGTH=73 /DNA_ID=CAMNT_0021208341 /DNA_START=127 /DNA_END=348 /DNA_ORIENTATION=+